MKQTIFAAILVIATTAASFAGGNKANTALLNNINAAFKNAAGVKWVNTAATKKATFSFNGKETSALYDVNDDQFIGFSTHYAANELPQTVTDGLQKKYADWTIQDASMLVDYNGYISYFVQVAKGDNSLVLKVTPDGKAQIYGRP
ncbi:MAG TPA: hypothetical protein PL045_11205 [Chitinophagaceae bacterium]|nr:hypothetical protein [Chitinophagaceae bacterium]